MLLRSFKHFNDTVFRGPDMEGGDAGGASETDLDTGGSDVGSNDTDGGGDGGGESHESQPLTVREQLKKAIAETSEPQPKKEKRDPKTGRFGDRQPKGQEAAPQEDKTPAQTTVTEPPASLPKELKADWDKAPPAIQQAFLKREADMAKGVEELKSRYNLIDQAIAPHTDALRQMNATPGEAVNRMFLWFKALANSPAQAFPELARSMGVDWAKVVPQQARAAPAAPVAGTEATGAAPEIPEPVKQYVGTLEKQIQDLTQVVQQVYGGFNGIQQNMNSQNEARTRENLSIWAKDKPYFDDVRVDMAQLIEKQIIPLKPDGQVDLDTAYERAIYFNPTVRAKVLAEQQQANQQVQQQTKEAATTAQTAQVTKARKAAVSLPVGGPGAQAPAAKKKPGEKLSVRDSLKAAMAELRDQ